MLYPGTTCNQEFAETNFIFHAVHEDIRCRGNIVAAKSIVILKRKLEENLPTIFPWPLELFTRFTFYFERTDWLLISVSVLFAS